MERPLTPQDLMNFQRDHFEGTPYDLTKGLAAGPYGDPNRYDIAINANFTVAEALSGEFPRATSLFRTSYSFVAHSRSHVPNDLALLWISQYAPDTSTYTPIYIRSTALPKPFIWGSMHVRMSTSFACSSS